MANRDVGNALAPLLRVVPLEGARNASVRKEFINLQYVPVFQCSQGRCHCQYNERRLHTHAICRWKGITYDALQTQANMKTYTLSAHGVNSSLVPFYMGRGDAVFYSKYYKIKWVMA